MFYQEYPGPASSPPCFVAARRNWYESGSNASKISETSVPQVLRYEKQPLILAENVQMVYEDGMVYSDAYGLHSFLELTGAGYKVIEGDKSRLDIQHLWWGPGAQIALPKDCLKIFHTSGQWD